MNEFKVGDKVRIKAIEYTFTPDGSMDHFLGKEGVITSIDEDVSEDLYPIGVTLSDGSDGSGFLRSELERVTKKAMDDGK